MEFIKAINYTGFNYHCIGEEKTKDNLVLMKRKTACNTVIIVLGALQDEPMSKDVDYQHPVMPKDADLIDFIHYARSLDLQVVLKPVVECRNGEQRGAIGVQQDDSWREQWFQSYSKFILHYAVIAEKNQCSMFFVGSQLLQLESFTAEWMDLIAKVRERYCGLLTYEADIYNEENILFWSSLDTIASAGNYPKSFIRKELSRLHRLAQEVKKNLLLTECGCMSMKGASIKPNDWFAEGELSLQEQVEFFQTLFESCNEEVRLHGLGIWCWNNRRLTEKAASMDRHYFIYGKPACKVIYEKWKTIMPCLKQVYIEK